MKAEHLSIPMVCFVCRYLKYSPQYKSYKCITHTIKIYHNLIEYIIEMEILTMGVVEIEHNRDGDHQQHINKHINQIVLIFMCGEKSYRCYKCIFYNTSYLLYESLLLSLCVSVSTCNHEQYINQHINQIVLTFNLGEMPYKCYKCTFSYIVSIALTLVIIIISEFEYMLMLR